MMNIAPDSRENTVDREDLILLLLDSNQRITSDNELRGITRLVKLLYLLAHEEKLESANALYHFEAYKFGPFSKDVYSATEYLRGLNLVEIIERPTLSYYATTEEARLAEEISDDAEFAASQSHEKAFALTESGYRAAKNLRIHWSKTRPGDLEKLDSVVSRYARLPLNQLIRYVYRQFPDTTINSLHPEARRA